MVRLDSCFHVGQVTGHNVDGLHPVFGSLAPFVVGVLNGHEFDGLNPPKDVMFLG